MKLKFNRDMKCIAIIPARGGSKGIPGKNLIRIHGKPLIAWSIQQALETKNIDRVIVSTDDSKISNTAVKYGAEVIYRPKSLSGAKTSSEAALLHVLKKLKKQKLPLPKTVVFLQPTSPLRQPHDIFNAIRLFEEKKADSLFSCGPVHGFVWKKNKKKWISQNYNYRKRPMRQDFPEHVVENGSIYIVKTSILEKYKNRLGGKIVTYPMGALESFQIDEPKDVDLLSSFMILSQERQRAKNFKEIKMVVFDFDGVMTDNRVKVKSNGEEEVYCHRGDGMGISLLKQKVKLKIFVLSTEKNKIVSERCEKLGLRCIQGCLSKLSILKKEAKRLGINSKNILFVGNDVNDVNCMKWVGSPVAVADATLEARKAAKFFTRNCGGQGAVREVCDWILNSKKKVKK